ncbi:MAG: D-aminoacyl-tRNA deacylase [Bacteroidales bacterium]|jgi:D-tyrosyl-tRNA(Tyr) deacylase|nr:D-aminoacyl-tRNA deacylase [Bacteroidales bacterium]
MRVVIQRVSEADVKIEGKIAGKIEKGLMVLVGIEERDGDADIRWLTNKIVNLRIFDDKNGVMNLSVKDIGGNILLISQFTLQASTAKGHRPSYIKAAGHETAVPLYEKFISSLSEELGRKIETGRFGADMKVSLINDGPVTICIDSLNRE